jgi:hypothetical protein
VRAGAHLIRPVCESLGVNYYELATLRGSRECHFTARLHHLDLHRVSGRACPVHVRTHGESFGLHFDDGRPDLSDAPQHRAGLEHANAERSGRSRLDQ